MSDDRALATTGKVSARDLAAVPGRPQIEPPEMYTGGPYVLGIGADEISWKHSLGWIQRSERRGGPCFVVVKVTFTGTFRVVERFPLTDAGWSRAWKALVKLDRDGAAMVLGVLANRVRAAESKAALAEMTAQSIGYLADVTYIAGSGELPAIASGSRLDVRFLADRLVFVPFGSPRVLAGFSYQDVEAVEIGGPGRVRRWTPGQQVALGVAFGIGAELLAATSTRVKTVVRIQTDGCELFVVHTKTEPDVLRMELSRALWAIREAREESGRPGLQADGLAGSGDQPPGSPGAVVDRLAKLASLLESGLLTRAEFDRLKAALLDGQEASPPDGPTARLKSDPALPPPPGLA